MSNAAPVRTPIAAAAVLIAILCAAVFTTSRIVDFTRAKTHAADIPRTTGDNALDAELTAIAAEASPILRLRRLADWVAAHSLEEVEQALGTVPYLLRADFAQLLAAKIADLPPGAHASSPESARIAPRRRDFSSNPRPPPTVKDRLLELAVRDPEEALRLAQTDALVLASEPWFIVRIFAAAAATDPRRAVALLASAKGVDVAEARKVIAESWARQDPAAALAWASTLPPSRNTRNLVEDILSQWGKQDVEAALEAALSSPVASRNRKAVEGLMGEWLRTDPEHSLAWLKTQPALDDALRLAAIRSFANSHPRDMAELLRAPMSETERRNGTLALAEAWAIRDPASAQAWLSGLPKGELYFATASVIAGKLAASDVSRALALYASLPPQSNRDGVASAIALAMSDKNAALTWLTSQHDSIGIRHATASLLYSMDIKAPSDAIAWAARTTPGPTRDRGLGAVMCSAGVVAHADALRLADLASTPAAKTKLISDAFVHWHNYDPAQTKAVLLQANLAPEEKQTILHRCERGY